MKIVPYLFFFLATVSGFSMPASAQSQIPSQALSQPQPQPQSPSQVPRALTLADAEKLALQNHPQFCADLGFGRKHRD